MPASAPRQVAVGRGSPALPGELGARLWALWFALVLLGFTGQFAPRLLRALLARLGA